MELSPLPLPLPLPQRPLLHPKPLPPPPRTLLPTPAPLNRWPPRGVLAREAPCAGVVTRLFAGGAVPGAKSGAGSGASKPLATALGRTGAVVLGGGAGGAGGAGGRIGRGATPPAGGSAGGGMGTVVDAVAEVGMRLPTLPKSFGGRKAVVGCGGCIDGKVAFGKRQPASEASPSEAQDAVADAPTVRGVSGRELAWFAAARTRGESVVSSALTSCLSCRRSLSLSLALNPLSTSASCVGSIRDDTTAVVALGTPATARVLAAALCAARSMTPSTTSTSLPS